MNYEQTSYTKASDAKKSQMYMLKLDDPEINGRTTLTENLIKTPKICKIEYKRFEVSC